MDEADTDLALEEEREAAARVREAAEEAAGGDTGYVLPTVPASTRAKGPPLGVVSVAALEAQHQLQPRKPTKVEAAKEEVALPILGRRSEIAATIASHRVTIIEGETGCGKSTQVRAFVSGSGWGFECYALCRHRHLTSQQSPIHHHPEPGPPKKQTGAAVHHRDRPHGARGHHHAHA